MTKRCAIVGGTGALGKNLVKKLQKANLDVTSFDFAENAEASHNVIIKKPASDSSNLKIAAKEAHAYGPFDAIICVAGGWCGGNATSDTFIDSVSQMWERNVMGATLAAHIAGTDLIANDGLVVFISAKASLSPTPGMIGYGMAKVATNQLVGSLAAAESGPISKATILALLPETLDTEANRSAMPNANFGDWTKLDCLNEKILQWINKESRPANGSLITVVTKSGENTFSKV